MSRLLLDNTVAGILISLSTPEGDTDDSKSDNMQTTVAIQSLEELKQNMSADISDDESDDDKNDLNKIKDKSTCSSEDLESAR